MIIIDRVAICLWQCYKTRRNKNGYSKEWRDQSSDEVEKYIFGESLGAWDLMGGGIGGE